VPFSYCWLIVLQFQSCCNFLRASCSIAVYNFSFAAELFARIRQTIFVAKSFTASGQFVSAQCSSPLQVSLLLVNLCLQITFFTFAGEFSCAYISERKHHNAQ
jgi:hypothetical protein